MKKRIWAGLFVLAALGAGLAWWLLGRGVYRENGVVLDASRRGEGQVAVSAVNAKRLKARITQLSSGGVTYTFDLPGDGSEAVFPLSQGPGEYRVEVYENTLENRYIPIFQREIEARFDPRSPFLWPNQIVDYAADGAAAQKAAVFDFVADHLSYDGEKAETVESGYLPDADDALAQGHGICQDYAALTAAMLRSIGIPCRMAVGYTSGGEYHAWVSVWSEEAGLIDDTIPLAAEDWTLLDPTFVSGQGRSQAILDYVADSTNYRTKYVY